MQPAVLDDAGADRDRHVHVAGEAQVAAGTAVDAALDRLELVDDFHRPDLRRARQRAGWEGGTQHVEAGHAVLQHALDVADDVHHVRVAFDGERLGHLDAAGLGDAADVVARQVDQHHMLGALLRVGLQLGFERQVLGGRGAARARARERPDRHLLLAFGGALLAHQDLGRGADDLEIAHVVEVHVGRRVQRTQRAVEAERRLGVALGDALADLHLHHVAGGDVLLGPQHRREVVGSVELALDRLGRPATYRRRLHAGAEAVAKLGQPALGTVEGLGLARVGVDDQVETAGQVVDHRQLFALQQQDVGRAEPAGLFRLRELGSMKRTAS